MSEQDGMSGENTQNLSVHDILADVLLDSGVLTRDFTADTWADAILDALALKGYVLIRGVELSIAEMQAEDLAEIRERRRPANLPPALAE